MPLCILYSLTLFLYSYCSILMSTNVEFGSMKFEVFNTSTFYKVLNTHRIYNYVMISSETKWRAVKEMRNILIIFIMNTILSSCKCRYLFIDSQDVGTFPSDDDNTRIIYFVYTLYYYLNTTWKTIILRIDCYQMDFS